MTEPFPVTIYFNPNCATSRNALAMIRAAGYEPRVVEYLKVGWNRPLLEELLRGMRVEPQAIVREKGTRARELGLLEPAAEREAILVAMLAEPVLVNRPIVVTPRGTRLCRPSETVLGLLERQPGRFVKEDGEIVHGHDPTRAQP